MPSRVAIRHPGYRPPNIIFSLPAKDGPNHDQAHWATVYAAGAIFTEQYTGIWLSKDQSGEPRIELDDSGLILAGEYYLHVRQAGQTDASPYAVTPNFRVWRFPTGSLLPLWQRAAGEVADVGTAHATDLVNESCRITSRRLACETAHIIPTSEKPWFSQNEMDRYGQISSRSGEAVVDSPFNQMRLRRDAHWLWDNLHFSVVPREVPGEPGEPGKVAWFTQMLGEDEELFQHWHCKKLQSIQGRSAEYMFARFAWDLFPRLHSFLQAGQERCLAVWHSNGEREIRVCSPSQCRQFSIGQGRGRSASSIRKRPSHENDEAREHSVSTTATDESSDACRFDSGLAAVDWDDGFPKTATALEEPRGRKRQRCYDI